MNTEEIIQILLQTIRARDAEIVRLKEILNGYPAQLEDYDSPCTFHGTTMGELEDAEHDPKARIIWPYDSQDQIVVRIGDRVATKYGHDWTIKSFGENGTVHFEETDKVLSEDKIAWVVNSQDRQ